MRHNVRGKIFENYQIGPRSFLKVGGACDRLFFPEDLLDLMEFLKDLEGGLTILGNMSNVLISDEGIRGTTIKLDRLNKVQLEPDVITVEAGANLNKFIMQLAKDGIACCEELFMIPGTIGGAIAMNAGTPIFEIKEALVAINTLDQKGRAFCFSPEELGMSYRNGGIPKGHTIVSAKLKYRAKDVLDRLAQLKASRIASQPIGEATCGSTFKNPQGMKAWQLIKSAGCTGLQVGGAMVSTKHCNFFINTGSATAKDFEKLIETIKSRVFETSGVLLEEEVRRIPGVE